MKYNSMIPELTVLDINITKDFYIEKLGFKLEYERNNENFIFLSLGESQFMFEQYHTEGWNTDKLEYPFGRGINFSISVPNIYKLYEKVLSCGIEIYRNIQEAIYKCNEQEIVEIQFLIKDPDGYLLRFIN